MFKPRRSLKALIAPHAAPHSPRSFSVASPVPPFLRVQGRRASKRWNLFLLDIRIAETLTVFKNLRLLETLKLRGRGRVFRLTVLLIRVPVTSITDGHFCKRFWMIASVKGCTCYISWKWTALLSLHKVGKDSRASEEAEVSRHPPCLTDRTGAGGRDQPKTWLPRERDASVIWLGSVAFGGYLRERSGSLRKRSRLTSKATPEQH